jgi:hypothetical protein
LDPADLALANETLLEVQDFVEGARRVGTTDLDAVSAARTRWGARWEAREAELRGAQQAQDCTLRGEGVRALLDLWLEYEDEVLPAAVRDAAAAHGVAIPEELLDEELGEDAESYPSAPHTGAWLRTLALPVVEAIATDCLRRHRQAERNRWHDPVTQQLRAEEEAALDAIRAQPVPWVAARPKVLGAQASLLDAVDAADDTTGTLDVEARR